MQNFDSTNRIQTIRDFVEDDDLNAAIKRLMDLVRDVAPKKISEVNMISRNYSALKKEIRILGKLSQTEVQIREVAWQILSFLDELTEQQIETNPTMPSTQPVIKNQPADLTGNGVSTGPHSPPTTNYEAARNQFLQKRKQPAPTTDIVFEGKEITRKYNSKTINFELGPLDLQLRLGEITALVGENGSGKTTLLKVVAGEMISSNGMIAYPHLLATAQSSELYALRQQIAYIPQVLEKWPGSLAKMLTFVAAIHGKKGKEVLDEVDFIINRLGLEKYRDASWDELSGGYKTRFTLAKMLLRQPKLLVLDEPLAHLDINTQVLFLQDLRDLTRSVARPMAVIVSSQHLHQIEDIADNIIFLRDGQALYNGRIDQFGEDRTENIFELGCDVQKSELLDILEQINYTRIERYGRQFLLYTPCTVTANDILKLLINHCVKIQFFRNISRSTRILFGEVL